MAAAVGILFGLPSLRIRGFSLAVATLAAQFFILWFLTKVGWVTNYTRPASSPRSGWRSPHLVRHAAEIIKLFDLSSTDSGI